MSLENKLKSIKSDDFICGDVLEMSITSCFNETRLTRMTT